MVFVFSGKCEIEKCGKEATRLSSKPEGGIIDICDDCWHRLYRS
jgi:ribosome-binding protein aMBF1 (putative translation factor)